MQKKEEAEASSFLNQIVTNVISSQVLAITLFLTI